MSSLLILLLAFSHRAHSLAQVASYSNVWVDPDYILARRFDITTGAAQNAVSEWATLLAARGPWCKSGPSLPLSPILTCL